MEIIVPEQNYNVMNVIYIKKIHSNWEVGANFLIFHNNDLKYTMYSSWHINGKVISNASGI